LSQCHQAVPERLDRWLASGIDDDEAIGTFRFVDAIADTVGGEVAAKLIAKVKQNGSFGSPLYCQKAGGAKSGSQD